MISRTYINFICDYSKNSGEGYLAHAIIEEMKSSGIRFTVYSDRISKYLQKKKFLRDRVLPIYYFILILYFRLISKHTLILNFNPLWNFLNFFAFRLGCKIGPVNANFVDNSQKVRGFEILIRLILQIIFFRISVFLIPKGKFIWSATNNVYNYLSKYETNTNFSLPYVNLVKKELRDLVGSSPAKVYDIFIYSGLHFFKNHLHTEAVIKEIINTSNLKLCYVGPNLGMSSNKLNTYHEISSKKFNKLLSQSKVYLSLSKEQSGITGLKALQLGLPIYTLPGSGLSCMVNNDKEYVYDDFILSRLQYMANNYQNFEIKSKNYADICSKNFKYTLNKWIKDLCS